MDATTLDIYNETMGDNTYLKLEDARNEKLLNKWLTINNVEQKTMKQTDFKTGEEREVDKLVLGFEEITYVLPLNKTNGRVMINDYGPQTDNWLNIKVKLKVNHYPKFEGIGIKSLQDLEDEGETPPQTSSQEANADKDIIKKAVKANATVKDIVTSLTDMGEQPTVKNVVAELKVQQADNSITKKHYVEALELLI